MALSLRRVLHEGGVTLAHWHDFNPWADHCLYISQEAYEYIFPDGRAERMVKGYGSKLDVYLLENGAHYSCGIRYGKADDHYLSPHPDQERAKEVWKQFR